MTWKVLHEVKKKTIHLSILVVLIFFFAIETKSGKQAAILFLVGLLLLFLFLEFLRLELNLKLPFFHQFIRPKEQFRLYGIVFFLSATIIAFSAFDPAIAWAALLMTVFGDMVAAIAGKKYGTTILFKNKTVAGFVSELVTNLVIAVLISLVFSVNIYVPILMAFVATGVETLVEELDDNLVVPLASGFIGQILLLLI